MRWKMPQLVSSGDFAQLDSGDSAAGEQPTICALASGGFVAAWQPQSNGPFWFQLYNSDGNAVDDPIEFAPLGYSGLMYISLAATPDGGFVATWDAVETPHDSFVGIGMQFFNSTGAAVG